MQDNFQFGRSLDNMQRGSSRQPRTLDEASKFLEVVSNLVRSALDSPISNRVTADLCAPLIVLLPLFFVPNLLPILPNDNSDSDTSTTTTEPPPTLLAQYTIRPDPAMPPAFWRPHRNMTGLTQDQEIFEDDWMWNAFESDNFDWDSEDEDNPASEDVVISRPSPGYGLPRANVLSDGRPQYYEAEAIAKRPSLSYGLPQASVLESRPSQDYRAQTVKQPSLSYGLPRANVLVRRPQQDYGAEDVVTRPSLEFGTPRVTKDLDRGQKDPTVMIGPNLPPSHPWAHLEKTRTREPEHRENANSDGTRPSSRPLQNKFRVFGAPRRDGGHWSNKANQESFLSKVNAEEPRRNPQKIEKRNPDSLNEDPQRVTLESLLYEDYDQLDGPFDDSENNHNNLWDVREASLSETQRRNQERSEPADHRAQLKKTPVGARFQEDEVWRRKRLIVSQ